MHTHWLKITYPPPLPQPENKKLNSFLSEYVHILHTFRKSFIATKKVSICCVYLTNQRLKGLFPVFQTIFLKYSLLLQYKFCFTIRSIWKVFIKLEETWVREDLNIFDIQTLYKYVVFVKIYSNDTF